LCSRSGLKPARKGHGIVAGGAVRAVCELAGIKDLSAKILSRTPNKLSNARATINALQKIKSKGISQTDASKLQNQHLIKSEENQESEVLKTEN